MKRTGIAVAVAVMALLVSGCATGTRSRGRQEVRRVQHVQEAMHADQHAAPPLPLPQIVTAANSVEARKYLAIGTNPTDTKRPTRPHERVFSLADDAYVVTKDRKGRVAEGWLKAGEQVFAVPASDQRYWEAIAIKRCGNPILNRLHGVAPIWISDPAVRAQSVAQQPVAPQVVGQQQFTAVPVPVPVSSEPVPCAQRKSGWGSVIGGAVGFVGGLITRKPAIAAATAAGGAMIGGWFDGECLEPQDVAVAAGWGIAGFGLTKP
ncbi:hypothetical protein A2372_01610 [Candidatus Wolfebacteria bacterium RIFOXYB1_FULL_54_12]|uniref:Glycine zipper domain-containing protein n=1 Tax=Candidatus Wolfebacteria bacterium RIFOXYB1_FULL_54_12 TaxID=1802559 RepID=A0A1F8DX17_9BACT|nr:MAG: hypothetical protein A2372_01610 [Candidatus Wolfebacteria bacterium RIFOXYB1_FULL_54_12]